MKDQRQEAGDDAQQFLANNLTVIQLNQGVTEARAREIADEADVSVLVHRAFFVPAPPVEHYFMKGTNLSSSHQIWSTALPGVPPGEHYFIKMTNLSSRNIEVTHIWFDTDPQAHLLNPTGPLDMHLDPYKTREVCVLVADVPEAPKVLWLGRVRLSSGKTIKSQPNEDVPPVGHTAGSQLLIMRVVLVGQQPPRRDSAEVL